MEIHGTDIVIPVPRRFQRVGDRILRCVRRAWPEALVQHEDLPDVYSIQDPELGRQINGWTGYFIYEDMASYRIWTDGADDCATLGDDKMLYVLSGGVAERGELTIVAGDHMREATEAIIESIRSSFASMAPLC